MRNWVRLMLAVLTMMAASAAYAADYQARSGTAVLRIDALTDQILRVRIARDGAFPEDASWAVAHETRGKRVPTTATRDGFATAQRPRGGRSRDAGGDAVRQRRQGDRCR